MKLNINERLITMNILPKEDNFLTMRVIRGMIEKIGIKDEEFKEFNIKQDGNTITWDVAKDTEKEIPLGEKETDIIIAALKLLDKEKKITQRHFSLYEKFIKE